MTIYNSPDLQNILDDAPDTEHGMSSEELGQQFEKIFKPAPPEATELSQPVDPWSTQPARNIRKRYIQHGGLGNRPPVDGHYSHHDLVKRQCVHCKETFTWEPDYDFTMNDFGEVIDNLCLKCRKELRAMRTNHPEMQ